MVEMTRGELGEPTAKSIIDYNVKANKVKAEQAEKRNKKIEYILDYTQRIVFLFFTHYLMSLPSY